GQGGVLVLAPEARHQGGRDLRGAGRPEALGGELPGDGPVVVAGGDERQRAGAGPAVVAQVGRVRDRRGARPPGGGAPPPPAPPPPPARPAAGARAPPPRARPA